MNFHKCGTRFYPGRSGAVRYKVLVIAHFTLAILKTAYRSQINRERLFVDAEMSEYKKIIENSINITLFHLQEYDMY